MPPFMNDTTQSCFPERFQSGCALFIRRVSILLCFFALTASPLLAEHTRTWRQASYEDFLKGTPHGVAVRSDGRLELAPKFTLIADADASYLWSLRVDPKGPLYAAAGSPPKAFPFDGKGTPRPPPAFHSTALPPHSIALSATLTLN